MNKKIIKWVINNICALFSIWMRMFIIIATVTTLAHYGLSEGWCIFMVVCGVVWLRFKAWQEIKIYNL